MILEVRPLKRPQEIAQVIELQARVWGLSPRDTMSPITLTALCQDYPRTGWLMGGFLDERMVALAVMIATTEPGLVYGHMLGVLPELRDGGLGRQLMEATLTLLERRGARRACWTFEPLEARNAHLYLNKLGGRAMDYHQAHFHLEGDAGQGLPLDRFLYILELARRQDWSRRLEPLEQALAAWPLAKAGHIPEAPMLLVEIPPDLQALLASDPAAALRWRAETRAILEECLGARGMAADRLYSGLLEGRRRCFYRLSRP
ncbi:MAG: GNAT family N-acetyltransferase [Desulfarculus sp.]|nr:GNAT family N-acetyltransferase [Desulfarculus sp.]